MRRRPPRDGTSSRTIRLPRRCTVEETPLMPETAEDHPATPNGRYLVVRRRLWRMSNPDLDEDERASLRSDLMSVR
jgi:hypothetical protein